jgi:hypothetical protein
LTVERLAGEGRSKVPSGKASSLQTPLTVVGSEMVVQIDPE